MAILEAGQYIKHFQYGCGVITESSSERTTIDFDAHGVKKFVTSLMVVEPADGVPPKRRRAKRVQKLPLPLRPMPLASSFQAQSEQLHSPIRWLSGDTPLP